MRSYSQFYIPMVFIKSGYDTANVISPRKHCIFSTRHYFQLCLNLPGPHSHSPSWMTFEKQISIVKQHLMHTGENSSGSTQNSFRIAAQWVVVSSIPCRLLIKLGLISWIQPCHTAMEEFEALEMGWSAVHDWEFTSRFGITCLFLSWLSPAWHKSAQQLGVRSRPIHLHKVICFWWQFHGNPSDQQESSTSTCSNNGWFVHGWRNQLCGTSCNCKRRDWGLFIYISTQAFTHLNYQKSTCNQHHAIADRFTKYKGLDISGIGATACARHGAFCPGGVVNFQRGEWCVLWSAWVNYVFMTL